jgi:hypothetical protein
MIGSVKAQRATWPVVLDIVQVVSMHVNVSSKQQRGQSCRNLDMKN